MNEQLPPTPSVPETPPPADETVIPTASDPRWWVDRKRLAGAVAGVAVVAAVGVGGGYALGHSAGSDATATGQLGARFGAGNGPLQGGPPGAQGMPGMQGGAMPGDEQHVSGTLTGTGEDTVTVKTSSGTQTYTVTSATQILQDGSSASLSELTTGRAVVVHVFPGGSHDGTAERVLVGSA